MQKKVSWIISLIMIAGTITAQKRTSSAITLFDLDQNHVGEVFQNARYLTAFNPDGYNDQPSFFDQYTLYLTSDWQAKGHTDIIKLNLLRYALLKITDTEESDYSPKATPDDKYFSVVSVAEEKEGDRVHFLIKYPMDRSSSGEIVSFDIANVGDHAWLNDHEVFLFLSGTERIVLYDTSVKKITDIQDEVGSCLKINNHGELIYVHKAYKEIWYLKSYNPTIGTKKIIGETIKGIENFEILKDNSILMAHGGQIHQLSEVGGWKMIDDLSRFGIENVIRIAAFGNKVALVHAN